jgi:hypothetical protein
MRTRLKIDRSLLTRATRSALAQTATDLQQAIHTQQPSTGVSTQVLGSGGVTHSGNRSTLSWSAPDAARLHDGYTTATGQRVPGSPWTVLTHFDAVNSFKQFL